MERDDDMVIEHDGQSHAPLVRLTAADQKSLDLARAMQEHGSEAVLSIYRQTGTGQESMEFVAKAPADKRSLEDWLAWLKEHEGGGDYRFQMRKNGRLVQNTLFSVSSGRADSGKVSPSHAMVPVSGEQGSMLQMLIESQRRSDERMERILSAMTQKRGINWERFITPEFVTAAVPLLGLFLKGMGKKNPLSDLQTLLAITGQVKDLREPEEKSADTWPALIDKSLGVITGVLQHGNANRQALEGPQNGAENRRGSLHPMAQAMSPHIEMLVQLSQDSADVDEVAPKVCQAVPPQMHKAFIDFIQRDDAVAQLGMVDNRVFAKLPWFVELQHCILDLLSDDGGDIPPANSQEDFTDANTESGEPSRGHAAKPDE